MSPTPLIIFFVVQKALVFTDSHLPILLLSPVLLGSYPKSYHLHQCHVSHTCCFRNVMVSGLLVRPFIPAKLIFAHDERKGSNLILLRRCTQFQHHHLLKRLKWMLLWIKIFHELFCIFFYRFYNITFYKGFGQLFQLSFQKLLLISSDDM